MKRTKLTNFRTDEDLATDLKETTDRIKVTQSDFIRIAVQEKLQSVKERLEKGEEVALSIG